MRWSKLLTGIAMIVTACNRGEIIPSVAPDIATCVKGWCADGKQGSQALPLANPVAMCATQAQSVEGRFAVQILIDSSGSLRGFSRENVIVPAYQWARLAVQQLGAPPNRTTAISGVWAFDEGLPTHEVALADNIEDYAVSNANTNLDDAIADRAEAADATVIITDGVPYVGGGANKACAGTADPSCVANQLITFLNRHSNSGMWILPLLAEYNGPLDTEGGKIPTDDQYTTRVTSVMRSQFGDIPIELRVDNGKLTWHGPKMLILFVLAKDHVFGRLLTWSLMAHAREAQVPLLTAPASWQELVRQRGGYSIGAMTPIEVSPGVIPVVDHLTATPVTFPPELDTACSGTITVNPAKLSGNQTELTSVCGANQGLAAYDLGLHTTSDTECIQLYVLPLLQIALTSQTKEFTTPDQLCTGGSADKSLIASVRVDLKCPAGAPETNADTIKVSAQTSFIGLDEAIRRAKSADPGALGHLKKFTTDSIPEQPWAVLGLDALIEQVARGDRQYTRADSLATINVQRQPAGK